MKLRFLGFLSVLVYMFSFVNAQINPMELPKLTQYVTDFSNILEANDIEKLESTASLYDKQTSNQILAVLIPNRNGYELFDIGMNLFNTNGIGQSDKNNGLLLIISTEEKKLRIIPGYGLEGQMPDLLINRIIEQDIRPLINSGDFAGAIRIFYEKSIDILDADQIPSSSIDINKDNEQFLFFGVMLGFITYFLFKKKQKKPIFFAILSILLLLLSWFSIVVLYGFLMGLLFSFLGISPGRGMGFGGGGFGGFSSGGGGGFSGGGGSSGGGGAGD